MNPTIEAPLTGRQDQWHSHLDQCLNTLASGEELFSEEHVLDAKKIAKRIKKLRGSKTYTIASIAGGFGAAGSALGSIPLVGGVVGSPFAFAGNFYGTLAGAHLGFDYAEQCDTRQDLFTNYESFYTSLATRLLDRYLRTLRIEQAKKIEKTDNVKVLDKAKKQKQLAKRADLLALTKQIEFQIPILEKISIDVWDHRAAKASCSSKKKEKISKEELYSKRIEKEIKKAINPLKEACQYILGESTNFSSVILHNELITMTTLNENKLKEVARHQLNEKAEKEKTKLQKKVKSLQTQIDTQKNENDKLRQEFEDFKKQILSQSSQAKS